MKMRTRAAIQALFFINMFILFSCGKEESVKKMRDSSVKGQSLEDVSAAADDPELAALKGDVEKLKNQAAPLLVNLDAELLRLSLLRNELLGDTIRGCWASERIERLDLSVVGSIIDEKLLWESKEKGQKSGPQPWSMTYVFGDGIRIVNPDERQVATFALEGQMTMKTGFTGELIGEIDRVEVTKGGMDVRNEAFDYCSGIFKVKCQEWTRVYETGRFRIDGVTLKVNGDKILYENNNIGVVLDGNRLSWKDYELEKNSAYKNLMSRKDCEINK